MTTTPSKRPVPDFHDNDLLDFEAAAAAPGANKPSPWVVAHPFADPLDSTAFAAIFAVQMRDGEPWLIRGVLKRRDLGAPILSRITVEHLDGAREVSGQVMRDLNFGAIRDEAFASLRERQDVVRLLKDVGWAVPATKAEALDDAAAQVAQVPRRRPRRDLRVDHYRQVAIRYLELVALGRRDVLNALAEEYDVGRETVRDWLRKATRLEFLTTGKPGRASRAPGPRLQSTGERL